MSTTNFVDREITPDNKAAQWALTPIYIPLAVVTLVIDNFIIAPVVHLPSAFVDTVDFWDADLEGYYANMGIIPFKLVLTPVVFVVDWFSRTIYSADTKKKAVWAWPVWGHQWQRDQQGRLIGPPKVKISESSNIKQDLEVKQPVKDTKKEPVPKEQQP